MVPGAGDDLGAIAQLMQSGGPTAALSVVCWFMYRLEKRVSRIEKAVDLFLHAVIKTPTIVKQLREHIGSTSDS